MDGKTVDEASAEVGVKPQTVYQWKKRFPDWWTEMEVSIKRVRDEIGVVSAPFDAGFRQKYLHYPTPPHMQKMVDLINDLGPREWGIILIPPGHGKSAIVEDYVCHQVAMNPNVRIFYISKGLTRAKKSVGLFQERFTSPQYAELFADYGPFKTEGREAKPWTSTHFTVARKNADYREYTVEALGIGGHLTGSRADIIILDDIADEDNQSASMIEDMYEYIFKVVRTRLVKTGKVICVGTRFKEEDIYSKLMDVGFFHKQLIMPAILRWPGTDGPEDSGEFLWDHEDSVTTPEDLLASHKLDARMFELIYQQNPIPSEGSPFPMEVIESCFNDKMFIGNVPSGTRVVVGIDPAVTGFTAGVVLAVDPRTGHRFLVDVWNERNLMGDGGDHHAGLVQFTLELCKKYGAERCCIESNSAFVLFTQSHALRQGLTNLGVTRDLYTSGNKGAVGGENSQEDHAISLLSNLFSNGMLTIPTAGYSRGHVQEFVNQFWRWQPGDKKLIRDIVKAFQMADQAAKRVYADANFVRPPERKNLPGYLRRRRSIGGKSVAA